MGSSTHSDNESVYSNDPSIASNTRGDDASSTGAQSLLSSLADLPSKAKRRQMKQSRTITHRERSNSSKQRDADGNHVRSRSRHNTRKDPEYDDESTVASNTIASESIFTANIVEEGRHHSSSHRNNSNRSSSNRSSSSSRGAKRKKKELCTTNCSSLNICSGVHIKTLIFCILGTTAIMKLTSNPPLINTSHGISSGTAADNNSGGLGSSDGLESIERDLKSNLRGSTTVSDVLDIDGVVKPTYNDGSDEEDSEDKEKEGDEDEEEGSEDKEDLDNEEEDVKEAFDPPEDITESQQDQFNQLLGSLGTPIEQKKPNSLMSSPAANSLLQSDVPPPPSIEEDAVETAIEEVGDSVLEEGSTLQEGAPATTYEGSGFTSQLQLPQLATTQQQTGLVGSDPSLAIQPQIAAGQAPVLGVDGTVQSPLLQTQQVQGGAGISGLGQTQTSLLQPQQQFVLPGPAPVQQQDASSQLQQLQISPTGGLTPSSTGGGVDVNAAQQRLDEHASNGFDIESAQAKLKKLQDLQAQLAARQAAQQQQQQMVPAGGGVVGAAAPLAPASFSGGEAAEPQPQSATITQDQQVAPQVDAAGSSLGAFDPTLFQPPVAAQQQQVQDSSGGGGDFAAPSVQQDVPTIQEQAAMASGGGLEQSAASSEVAAPKAEFDPFRPV